MSPSELALLLLLAIAGHTQARARPRPDMFCIFHGKKYSPGDSWHPYLEPQGVVYCIRCMCSESGSVTCYKIKCPILQCIHTVTDPHQCCPRCVETPSGLRAAPKVCQHNGTTYQQGEMFTTQELFPSRQSNQCVQCSCSDGQIYCGLVTCPELVCSSPMTVPDSCCPVCRDTGSFERSVEEEPLNRGVRHSHDHCISELLSKRSFGATESTSISSSLGFNPRSFKQKGGGGGTTIKILMKEKHKKACIYNGRTYSHGEVWHPVFRNFGAIPCVLCTCKDGTQDCQRVTCPEEYPCDNPEKVEGKCCKVCQDDKVKPTEIATARCVKNPHKILVYMYMSPNSGNQKENLRKIAIEKEASEDVEIYVWKMVKGIFHLIQIKKVAKQDFRQEAEHFRLVTRTSEGQWNIFRPQPPDLNMTEITELQSEAL